MLNLSLKSLWVATAIGAMAAVPAKADLIFTGTGTDSDGSPISATADFSLSGNTFQVVITNNNVANSQASVLTNLGFNSVPSPATPLPSAAGSAALTAGSSIVALGTPDSHTVGQEWAYLTGAPRVPGSVLGPEVATSAAPLAAVLCSTGQPSASWVREPISTKMV